MAKNSFPVLKHKVKRYMILLIGIAIRESSLNKKYSIRASWVCKELNESLPSIDGRYVHVSGDLLSEIRELFSLAKKAKIVKTRETKIRRAFPSEITYRMFHPSTLA